MFSSDRRELGLTMSQELDNYAAKVGDGKKYLLTIDTSAGTVSISPLLGVNPTHVSIQDPRTTNTTTGRTWTSTLTSGT
jgi:hypothetical protein